MTDVVDQLTRSQMIAGIKGKNIKLELIVRRFLNSSEFRYRLHDTESENESASSKAGLNPANNYCNSTRSTL